jgi:hypothetical protein
MQIFLSDIASRSALGPIQFPIQWVQGALSLGIKRSEREADHSPLSSVEVTECMEINIYSNRPSWRGAQLKKSQGQLYLTFTFKRLSYPL